MLVHQNLRHSFRCRYFVMRLRSSGDKTWSLMKTRVTFYLLQKKDWWNLFPSHKELIARITSSLSSHQLFLSNCKYQESIFARLHHGNCGCLAGTRKFPDLVSKVLKALYGFTLRVVCLSVPFTPPPVSPLSFAPRLPWQGNLNLAGPLLVD